MMKTHDKPKSEKGNNAAKLQATCGWVRLSDPEMAPKMDALKKQIKNDPQFGLNLMVKAGILTPKGNLKKIYTDAS